MVQIPLMILIIIVILFIGTTIFVKTRKASRFGCRRDYKVKYVFCAGHGIRTDGRWINDFFDHMRNKHEKYKNSKETVFIPMRYGFLLASLCVWRLVRSHLIYWMERRLALYCQMYPAASINYIGHSYGTMLAFEAVRRSDTIQIDKMILVASIVSSHEIFDDTLGLGKIGELHCYCSKDDPVCKSNPFGHSGYWGFLRNDDRTCYDKPFDDLEVYNHPKNGYGHSDYFKKNDCLNEWVGILSPEKLGQPVSAESWLCPFIAGGPTIRPMCVRKACMFFDTENKTCLLVKSISKNR